MEILNKITSRGKINISSVYAQSNVDYLKNGNPFKSFVYSANFLDYTVVGEESSAHLINDLNVKGKDSYLRLDFEIDSTNIVFDTDFTLQLLLGNTGSDTHITIDSNVLRIDTALGKQIIRGNLLLPVKLSDYDWFQFTTNGITPPDADISARFTFENIYDNN